MVDGYRKLMQGIFKCIQNTVMDKHEKHFTFLQNKGLILIRPKQKIFVIPVKYFFVGVSLGKTLQSPA